MNTQYQLLDEGKVPEKSKQRNAFKRLIKSFMLPDPVDKIGEKKSKIEKIHLLLLILAVIAIVVYVTVHDAESFPKLSTAVKEDYNTSARIAVCSIDETSSFLLESVFIFTSARFCNYSRGVTNVDNCEGLILYEPGVNCVVFGSTNTSLWTIPHTAAPLFAINFVISRNIKDFVAGPSDLFLFYLLENDDDIEALGQVKSIRSTVADLVRTGYVYSVGFTQELRKANGKKDVRAFQTNILNLGVFTGVNITSMENKLLLPISFWLHFRSPITAVIAEQSPIELIFGMLSGIGGFASTASTVLTVLFSVLLTRLLFKDRDAYFKEETRLAATYFTKQSNVHLQ